MKVLALVFNGFEEEEAMAPFALLRRAKIDLTIASYKDTVTGCHNITLANVTPLETINYKDYDCLLLPGGPHYKIISNDDKILEIIKYYAENNKPLAAICASPTIIGGLGYLKNKNYTCFTSMNSDFGGTYHDDGVVVDGNLITGKSVAYSLDFAYAIIKLLAGEEVLNTVYKKIYYEK